MIAGDLLTTEEPHAAPDVALAGHGEDPLAVQQMSGLVHRDEAEEGADSGEPGIAAARSVAPLRLDVRQEVGDEVGVELLDLEPGGRFAALLAGEAQEQTERVAVARDRVGAGVHLRGEPLGKEALQEGREGRGGHGRASSARDPETRWAASSRSSGTASMYQ